VTILSIIVAVAANAVIGQQGRLPWRLSSDLKRFKMLTIGKPVIMGRKTFESIGKPLPGRLNIVVTRDAAFRRAGVVTVHSLDEAIACANAHVGEDPGGRVEEIFVIGGGEIYEQALPRADRLYVTHVRETFAGDANFPEIRPEEWWVAEESELPAGPADSHPTRFVRYERRSGRA
jgi:dihydrofolate reductase